MVNTITMAQGGTLQVGDIITFESVRWWPWYKRLWFHLRYFRHNNPMYKPAPELRQFVVTASTGSSYEIAL